MTVPDRTVTHVSWRDLFPWLILFRTLPITASLTVLAFATLGVVVTPVGWLAGEAVFLNDAARYEDPFFAEFVQTSRSPYRGVFDASQRPANYMELFGAKLSGARAVYERMVLPYRLLFRGGLGSRKFLYLATGCLWNLVVWSFAGCCIARYALFRLTRDETLPLDEVFYFGWQRWGVGLTSFAACFLVVFLLCLPGAAVGLLLINDWSAWIGGLLWLVVVGCMALATLLLFGLMFAWPLMITSIAAENQNALDSVTRSFAYVYQRPLHYALYGLLALLFGGFCWLVVSQLAATTIQLSFWNASWGANTVDSTRIDAFLGTSLMELNPAQGSETQDPEWSGENRSAGLTVGGNLIRFVNGLVSTVAVAFIYGLFWTMAAAVYLLLRYEVDETEMDEVYVDEASRVYELPPLKSDERGIPQIQPLENYLAEEQAAEPRDTDIDQLGE